MSVEFRSTVARMKLAVAMGNTKDMMNEVQKEVDRLESETLDMEGKIDALCVRVDLMAGHAARANRAIKDRKFTEALEHNDRSKELAADILSRIGWGREPA